MEKVRRDFLKISAMSSLAALMAPHAFGRAASIDLARNGDILSQTSRALLTEWCDALIKYQVTDKTLEGVYGGILCPSCARIHGRCSDAIYPLMYLAAKTGEEKYLQAAQLLFDWMEEAVSLPDGSWANDVNVSDWVGTTVFTSIALAEALTRYGDLLSPAVRERWLARLKEAADFIDERFHIEYSNINYPITGAYALLLLGELYNEERYTRHADQLARQSLDYFTEEGLLFGEGEGDIHHKSPKGCLPVDLGYNVEESLPALLLYGLHTGNDEVVAKVKASLHTHLEFMLPDGAWDNSWGTRNFKWTYWGSRTSDGCQPAYALASADNPSFYKAALQNTLLLKQCTAGGLLHGGPHFVAHDEPACIHHTFCHAKALATILDHDVPEAPKDLSAVSLPREQSYGVKFMQDIQVWLVSNENWKGTVVGYDKEYSFKNGHPTGGALSMLWHQKVGPVLAASMNQYDLIEAPNMQMDKGAFSMPLTARLETTDGVYMQISDLGAQIDYTTSGSEIVFTTKSRLVDEDQNSPAEGAIHCAIQYIFSDQAVRIQVEHDAAAAEKVRFVLPVISTRDEAVQRRSSKRVDIQKADGLLSIASSHDLLALPTRDDKQRIFNYVPGMQALPFQITGNSVDILLSVN